MVPYEIEKAVRKRLGEMYGIRVIPKEIREKLNPQQLSVYRKFRKAVKDFVDSKEIESITIDIGIVRVVVKGKKKPLNNSD
jgi:hypothetical protein